MSCRLEAPARLILRAPRLPVTGEVLVTSLGLFGDPHLLVAQRLDVVGRGGATPVALLLRLPGLQLHRRVLLATSAGRAQR